jgi:hypothetical protein
MIPNLKLGQRSKTPNCGPDFSTHLLTQAKAVWPDFAAADKK